MIFAADKTSLRGPRPARASQAGQTKTAVATGETAATLVEGEELPGRIEQRDRPVHGQHEVERTADAHVPGLHLVEIDRGEGGPGRLGDRQHREVLGQRVQGTSDGQVEGPDGGTPQRGEVPADAEPGAHVAGDGADVGAAGAAHRDVDVDAGRRRRADVVRPPARAR